MRIDPKRHYTTTEVAAVLHVAPATVRKWMDKGLLKGYSLPLGECELLYRRIIGAEVIALAESHGMMSMLKTPITWVYLGTDWGFMNILEQAVFDVDAAATSSIAMNILELGVQLGRHDYKIAFLDIRSDAMELAEALKEGYGIERVVLIANEDESYRSQWQGLHGIDFVWQRPFDVEAKVGHLLKECDK